MKRRLFKVKKLTSEDLLALSRRESNARKRMRLLAISLFLGNENRSNIAKRLSVARSSVNLWVTNYLTNGLSGLENKQGAGRPKKLSKEQLETLSKHILLNMHSELGGRLTGYDIGEFIYLNFNVRYNSGHVYKIIKSLGYSWITTRSKHPKQSEEAQESFKKVPLGNDPSHTI